MKSLISSFKQFYLDCKNEDFGFYCVAGYIVFSYLRPHVIVPQINVLPWTQLFILAGLIFAVTKKSLKFQRVHFSVLLFYFAAVLSSIYSVNTDHSFSSLNIILIWFVEVLFFIACVRTENQLRLTIILFFLVLFKISLFGTRTWIGRGFAFQDYGIAGPPGFFENSGELSLLMAMLTILSITLLLSRGLTKWLYIFPLTTIMTVLAASSRASQLGLLIGLFILFAIKGQFKIKYILLTVTVCYLGVTFLPEEQKARFSSAGEDSTSVARITYWTAGVDMYNKHPLTGVGFRCFPQYFRDHYSYMVPEGMSWGARSEVAHNTLVEVGSEMGTFGLLSYLYMYFLVFILTRATRKEMRLQDPDCRNNWMYQLTIGLDIAQIAFFVGAFFMSVALYPYNYFMLMFAGAAYNVAKQKNLRVR